jgi:hypothetical protein
MKELLFFTILSVVAINNTPDRVYIEVELIKPVKAEGISITVKVKNLSDSVLTVLKNRRLDYKWKKIKSLGNYIIEIEKWEGSQFHLFSPLTDIDPVIDKEEYVLVQKGGIIADSLYIPGYHFSGNGSPKGKFPPGNYRLRVSFNSNEWSSSQINSSTWAGFKIE